MVGVLDEVYQRMRGTSPEFGGWRSNHGPMAADALIRLGRVDTVDRWVDRNMRQMDDAPRPRWRIEEPDWREVFGDPSRVGDWCAFFAERVGETPWTELLATWWPRLLPGSTSAATHGLIRTGHAVRAVAEGATRERLGELAQGLGYWAARWQRDPHPNSPGGTSSPGEALGAVPRVEGDGGVRTRIADISQDDRWGSAAERLAPLADPASVPSALDDLVDAAVARYPHWAATQPVMLVRMATAPRAASLVVPHLPSTMWSATYRQAWIAAATIAGAYRPLRSDPEPVSATGPLDLERVIDRVVASGDEHAIKFAEVALESFRRGNPAALASAAAAVELIGGG